MNRSANKYTGSRDPGQSARRKGQFKIVLRDENCDNLIKQTIEFLEVVKGLKIDGQLDVQVVIEDVKEACCIHQGQVVWGYPEIVRVLMTPGNSAPRVQSFSEKSLYTDSVIEQRVEDFHQRILDQGDHDASDQLDTPNKVGKKTPLNGERLQAKGDARQDRHRPSINVQNEPLDAPTGSSRNIHASRQKQSVHSSDLAGNKSVEVNQVALDNEYHSRFLDELKSGGD